MLIEAAEVAAMPAPTDGRRSLGLVLCGNRTSARHPRGEYRICVIGMLVEVREENAVLDAWGGAAWRAVASTHLATDDG